MSEDKNTTDNDKDDKKSQADEQIEVIEAIEVEADEVDLKLEDDANIDESMETLDDLDDELDRIVGISPDQKRGFSPFISGILGGILPIVLLVGFGYYAITSNNLGGLGQLFNDDGTNVIEERYTNVSTRLFALEGEVSELQDRLDTPVEPVIAVDYSADIAAQALAVDDLSAQLADIQQQFGAMKQLLDEVSNMSVSGSADKVDGTALLGLQKSIEQQNADLAKVKTQIATWGEQLDAVKQAAETKGAQASNENASQMASALAVASLERALQDEKPFEVELNALQSFAVNNQSLSQLSVYAATGLVSETTLFNQFDGLLEAALVADLKGEGKSILDKFIGNAKSIISVRRTGNIDGDDAEAVLARMEVAIANKDLSAAIAQSDALSGPAQNVFADWLAAAKARLAAQDLMRQVSGDILQSLQ